MKNRLFKNMGSLQFRDVSQGSGTDDSGWGQSVTHTDLNADGKQDLIVGNDFGVNRYYINQGNMRFRDISKVIGTDKPSYTMGFGLADLNRDARPISVSNIVVMVKDEKYVQPNANTAMKLDPTKMARARVVEANDLFISNGREWSLSTLVGRGYDSTGWSWEETSSMRIMTAMTICMC